jgi:hypothetical protein
MFCQTDSRETLDGISHLENSEEEAAPSSSCRECVAFYHMPFTPHLLVFLASTLESYGRRKNERRKRNFSVPTKGLRKRETQRP